MNDKYFSAAELAGLPGMPRTVQGVTERARRENWQARPRRAIGGGREFHCSVLSPAAKDFLVRRLAAPATPTLLTPAGDPLLPVASAAFTPGVAPTAPGLSTRPVETSRLKEWQRATLDARAALVAEVNRLAAFDGVTAAVRTLVELAKEHGLPVHLQRLVPVANARAGSDGARTLSRSTLFKWIAAADTGTAALAPRSVERFVIPAWGPALLALYQQPQKPSLAWALERLVANLPAGVEAPSYSQARRFLDRMHAVERERGRMGAREIKTIRPYVKRDSGGLWPAEVYTADGHTFDAEVAHPHHGRPFRPEITTTIDVATRLAVGWSTGLAESTWAVLDALRDACTSSLGIPAVFYVDNGAGYRNALMQDEATGFFARLAITPSHSLPYNSQARGVIERSHQTIWVRGAKSLPTYMGADMDREARQKVFRITRADIKAGGTSRLLIEWADFVRWCGEQVAAYNARPHRALPKVRDQNTGVMRHQSPNEALAAAIAEGWKPVPVEATEVDDLFRPYKVCAVRRGLINCYGNQYFARELEGYHGADVRVGYDIRDASRVWVRDLQGRLICTAGFEANKRKYFPDSVIEQAAAKRAAGRIARAQVRIDEAREELQPHVAIEHDPTPALPVDIAATREQLAIEEHSTPDNVLALPSTKPKRPMWASDAAKFKWLMQYRAEITRSDETWLAWYRTTEEFEDLFGDGSFEAAAR